MSPVRPVRSPKMEEVAEEAEAVEAPVEEVAAEEEEEDWLSVAEVRVAEWVLVALCELLEAKKMIASSSLFPKALRGRLAVAREARERQERSGSRMVLQLQSQWGSRAG